jgi:hypothetical protein
MLPCLNCKTLVDPAAAKVFAGVFVCPTCHTVAERLEQRGTQELKALLTMQREAIRIALVEGRLQLSTTDLSREPTKQEVLQEVLRLAEQRDKSKAEGS